MLTRSLTCCTLVAVCAAVLVPQAWGQNNNNNNGGGNNAGGGLGGNQAGVVVSPDGVLRMKSFTDPGLGNRRLQEARVKLGADLSKPSKLRKVSLNRLEAALRQNLEKGAGPDEDMKYLAGLTRLEYVFFYPDTNDIVIAGPGEGYVADASGRVVGLTTGRATLELQDLVVALRAFGPNGDQKQVISVSIDPSPEGLKKMQQFLVNLGRITPGDDRRIAAGLQENLGLQNVTFQGVSPKTHFAQVLVEADYRMKLIGINLERPPVKILSYVDKAKPSDVARNAMERWYFTPNYECVRVSEDSLACQLVGEGVQLIGANEMVNADGGRINNGAVNLASKAFTNSFTQNYPQLAQKSPVYAQLRNLIDMSIAAAFIQKQDYYGQANWKMETLGDERKFSVEVYEEPKTVESAVNVIWKGSTLMTPIGGGVNIQPLKAIETSYILNDAKGEVAQLRKSTLDRLPDNKWWWD